MYRNNNESLWRVITLFSFGCTIVPWKNTLMLGSFQIALTDCWSRMKGNIPLWVLSINAFRVHYISSVHHYYYNVTTNPSRTYFVRFCLINLQKRYISRYIPSIWNSLYIFKRAPQNRVPFSKGLFSSQVKDVSSNTKERSSATTKSNSVSKYTKKIF